MPLAKYVAQNYGHLTFPFRRFQIGKVYRGGSPAGPLPGVLSGGHRRHRGREAGHLQRGGDPSIIYRAFTALGLKRFQIRVNNRKILNGFYSMLGLTEQSGDVMRTVDKLDKIGPDKVRELLIEGGVDADKAEEILKFIAITGSNQEVLTALEGYRGRSEVFDAKPGRAEHRGEISGLLRCAGDPFRRGSDHRPRPGLLHRNCV